MSGVCDEQVQDALAIVGVESTSRVARAESPTEASAAAAAAAISSPGNTRTWSGNHTFSSALRPDTRSWLWKIGHVVGWVTPSRPARHLSLTASSPART